MDSAQLKTILYVDDDADIRAIVQMALSMDDGVAAHACESGEQALSMMEEVKPDLVLLDVMMSGMDGLTTLHRMRQKRALADVPVIFMTAKSMPQEVAALREIGAIGVIGKPFDPMKLGQQVFTLWEKTPQTNPVADIPAMRTQLGRLSANFVRRTLEDVADLDALLAKSDPAEPATLKQVERLAHRMRGAGATLGFTIVSDCAGEIERLAEGSTRKGAPADSEVLARLALATTKLRGALEKLAQGVSSE